MKHENIASVDAQVLSFLRQYGKGHHTVGRCPVCGYMQWRSQRMNEPDGYTLEEPAFCPACHEVSHRAPEVFRWVMAVVAQAQLDITAGVKGLDDLMKEAYELLDGVSDLAVGAEWNERRKAMLAVLDFYHLLRTASTPAVECEHDLVSARNEVVKSGLICSKCFRLFPEGTPSVAVGGGGER